MNSQSGLKSYKGFTGSLLLDFDYKIYYGYILDIPMEVKYESDTKEELQAEFEDAVDYYIKISGYDLLINEIKKMEERDDSSNG